MMKQRRTVRRLKDLLPEVLIEAQGCDEITATAALRRAVEELCQSRGFAETTLKRIVRESNVISMEGELCTRLPLERQNVLRICSASIPASADKAAYMQNSNGHCGGVNIAWTYDDAEGILYLSYPCKVDTTVKIIAELMPDVDDDIEDVENFTKWRHLVVAKTLEDLFSMTQQPWANPTRYQVYADRARRYLEDYLSTERFYHGDARMKVARPSASSIFY